MYLGQLIGAKGLIVNTALIIPRYRSRRQEQREDTAAAELRPLLYTVPIFPREFPCRMRQGHPIPESSLHRS